MGLAQDGSTRTAVLSNRARNSFDISLAEGIWGEFSELMASSGRRPDM